MGKQLSYESAYAVNDRKGMIVRLSGGGYALLNCGEKKDNMEIQISDYAWSFLKFDISGSFRKVESEDDVPPELSDNAKYNLEHCGTVYGQIRHLNLPEIEPW